MARRTRLTVPGLPHLIQHRGHNGAEVFSSPCDRRFFLDALAEASSDHGCAVHAYTLLPDRVLLLCTPEDDECTSLLMQDLGRRYARFFNAIHDRSGTLWDGRYRQCVLDPDEVVTSGLRYVDGAAPRAGLASEVSAYLWSSAGAHLGLRPDPLVVEHDGYVDLGKTRAERAQAYREIVDVPMSRQEAERIERELVAGLVLGSEAFKDRLEHLLGRPVRAGKPGRPRKRASRVVEAPRRSGAVHQAMARQCTARR